MYVDCCNSLFDTYSKCIPILTAIFEEEMPKDPAVSKAAYTAALRAKVLDCLRGLLPAGTLTNMGVFGNGRFFESLIHKLQCHTLAEMQETGKRSFDELAKVIPSFVRRADPSHTHKAYAEFYERMHDQLHMAAAEDPPFPDALKSRAFL